MPSARWSPGCGTRVFLGFGYELKLQLFLGFELSRTTSPTSLGLLQILGLMSLHSYMSRFLGTRLFVSVGSVSPGHILRKHSLCCKERTSL